LKIGAAEGVSNKLNKQIMIELEREARAMRRYLGLKQSPEWEKPGLCELL